MKVAGFSQPSFSTNMQVQLRVPSSILDVEVCLTPSPFASRPQIEARVRASLLRRLPHLSNGILSQEYDPMLRDTVKFIRISGLDPNTPAHAYEIRIHLFSFHKGDTLSNDQENSAARLFYLPNEPCDGIWDSLIFSGPIKRNLMEYVTTALLFSDKGVDENVISWNRVVLLHGPPGTGKTSLCKGYHCVKLVEVNGQNLFSKYFAESGKLVSQLFTSVVDLCEDSSSLICVLIGALITISISQQSDEVETLTAARKAAMNGAEPTDSIRVVNAVLTHIDRLRGYPNCLILTTSNLTGALDLAFVDRTDIKVYIGEPELGARYTILKTCVEELMKENILDFKSIQCMSSIQPQSSIPLPSNVAPSAELFQLMKCADGLSGRRLRKLPFIAHSNVIQSNSCSLSEFLAALKFVISSDHILPDERKHE